MVKTGPTPHLQKDFNKIRTAILEGYITFDELIKETGLKNTTFHKRINSMIFKGMVKTRHRRGDRRITEYYVPNKNDARNEMRRINVAEFISEMENPVSSHKKDSDVSWNIYVVPESKDRVKLNKLKRGIDTILKNYSNSQSTNFQRLMHEYRIKKLAVTITIE